jgi:hypothetical protein
MTFGQKNSELNHPFPQCDDTEPASIKMSILTLKIIVALPIFSLNYLGLNL